MPFGTVKKSLIPKEKNFSHLPHFSPHGFLIYVIAPESQAENGRKQDVQIVENSVEKCKAVKVL
jgi:hypothetical protein